MVYAFVYHATAACQDTSSAVHKLLWAETLDLMDDATLADRADILDLSNHAGRYLWPGLSFNYTEDSGVVSLTRLPCPEGIVRKRNRTENERMVILANGLRKEPYVVQNKIIVQTTSIFKEMSVDVCPFTGGGDIFINKYVLNATPADGIVAVCLATELDETVLEPDSPTFSMEGHFRGPSLLECKRYSTQTQGHINLQLKANMMLALTHQFYNTLADTNTCQIQQRLGEVKELSGYGVTFGCSSTLEVYKLVMNFDSNTCCYYKHFTYPASPAMGYYLNKSLSYVITRVSKFKTN